MTTDRPLILALILVLILAFFVIILVSRYRELQEEKELWCDEILALTAEIRRLRDDGLRPRIAEHPPWVVAALKVRQTIRERWGR